MWVCLRVDRVDGWDGASLDPTSFTYGCIGLPLTCSPQKLSHGIWEVKNGKVEIWELTKVTKAAGNQKGVTINLRPKIFYRKAWFEVTKISEIREIKSVIDRFWETT